MVIANLNESNSLQFQNESCVVHNLWYWNKFFLYVHCLQTHFVHCLQTYFVHWLQTHFLKIIWKRLCTTSRFETEAMVTRKWFVKLGTKGSANRDSGVLTRQSDPCGLFSNKLPFSRWASINNLVNMQSGHRSVTNKNPTQRRMLRLN